MSHKSPGHEFTNRDICLYVLLEAGGDLGFVATEDVAVRAFELYPERFGLITYPQYPDVDSVRVTLTDLRKEKYRGLVQGDKKRGWKVTQNGVEWFRDHSERVREAIQSRHPKERRISSGRRLTSEKIRSTYLDRILTSGAFKKWKRGTEPSIYDFYELLRIDSYTPEQVYQKHLTDLLAALPEKGEARVFLAHLADVFGGRYRNNA